jgi:hypothetical protein
VFYLVWHLEASQELDNTRRSDQDKGSSDCHSHGNYHISLNHVLVLTCILVFWK